MLNNEFKCKPVCAGNNIKKIGRLDVAKDGSNVVIFDDEKDLDKIIQSFESECNIDNLIARFTKGDTLALVGTRGEGNFITKEQYEAIQRDPQENLALLNSIYDKSYNDFAGKDSISKADFIKLVKDGKYDELSKYMPKEGGEE